MTAGQNPATVAAGSSDAVTVGALANGLQQVIAGTGAAASLTIQGLADLAGQFSTGSLSVTSTGAATLDAGATLSVSGAATLFGVDGSGGAIALDGAGSALTVAGPLAIGVAGAADGGALALTGGGYVQVGGLSLLGDNVSIQIDDASTMVIGASAAAAPGELYVESGALFTISSYGDADSISAVTVLNNGSVVTPASDAFTLYASTSITNTGVIALANLSPVVDETDFGWVDQIIAPSLTNTGLISISGFAQIQATITGVGQIQIGSQSELTCDQVGAGQSISFTGPNGELSLSANALDASNTFDASISGFNSTDVIDFAGTATSAHYAGGVLTLLNGPSAVAQLNLAGTFGGGSFLAIGLMGGDTEIVLDNGGDTATPPAGTASAASYTWLGSLSGSWDAAANWDDVTAGQNPATSAPGSQDAVTIGAADALQTVITGTGDASSLAIQGPAALAGEFSTGSLSVTDTGLATLGPGDTLSVSGAATLDGNIGTDGGAIALEGAGSALTVAGAMSIGTDNDGWGGLTLAGGAYARVGSLTLLGDSAAVQIDAASTLVVGAGDATAPGELYVEFGSTLTISSDGFGDVISTVTLLNNGSIVTPGSESFRLYASTSITNTGVMTLGNDSPMAYQTNDGWVDYVSAPAITNTGLISILAGFTQIQGTIEGVGQIEIGSGGKLICDQVGAGQAIGFNGTGGQLSLSASSLDTSKTFEASISDFNPGDSIDFAGSVTGASYAGGVLTLLNGSTTVARLGIAGDYSNATFSVVQTSGAAQISVANSTANFEGVYRQYALGAGGSTVSGGPEGASDVLTGIHRVQFVDGYMAYSATDTAGQVYRVYEATLGRAPDPEGLAFWVNGLDTGTTSLQSVVNSFVTSSEFQHDYGGLTNSQFVTLLYQNVLGRAPDQGGLDFWTGGLNSGAATQAQVVLDFTEAQEDINASAAVVGQGLWVGNAYAAEVARLYDTVFSRLPDLAGLTAWTQALETGAASLLQEAGAFMASAEFQANYGSLNNSQFVTQLYEYALHRAPDQGGLNGWVDALNTGAETRAQVVVGFSESTEHIGNTAAHIDDGIWLAT